MRRSLLFIALTILPFAFTAQEFSWWKGATSKDVAGAYGTKGTPSSVNNPGGRSGACSWKDATGKFWIFGGNGFDFIANYGLLCDLWRYNPQTNEWTWMNGPDLVLQTGVYGTLGSGSSNNHPGGRYGATAWTDNAGDLWLFGGYGLATGAGTGNLNDLWKYSVANNEWTWMGGYSTIFEAGTYGTVGLPSATVLPGSRVNAAGWNDALGNFWLFGGFGCTTNSLNVGNLDDLWKYNYPSGQWTWVKGSNSIDQNGIYGTMGSPAPTNNPGGRQASYSWLDQSGNLWLFGGSGMPATGISSGDLNDMWRYNIPMGEWTWVKGTTLTNQTGTYSPTPALSNNPGGRSSGVTWVDAAGSLWLFGGFGTPASSGTGAMNDLWMYDITVNTWRWVRGSNALAQNGTYGLQGIMAPSNIPGARMSLNSWIDASSNIWLFGGNGYPASGPDGELNDIWMYRNCFVNALSPQISTNRELICIGESATLTASGADNFTWGTSSTGSINIVTLTVSTTYTIASSNTNSCVYTSTFTQVVDACNALAKNNDSNDFSVFPNPSADKAVFHFSGTNASRLTVINVNGKEVYDKPVETKTVELILPPGIYIATVTSSSGLQVKKVMVE
jgi:N-acetylneuraminic acid mutarotase